MTNVRGLDSREKRQTMINHGEFEDALEQAAHIKNEFLSRRALAVLSLLRLTGKRRGEIAIIPIENLKIEDKCLNVTFILEKKRKGTVLQKLATKSLLLSDPLTQNILAYLDYLKKEELKPKFWLPRAKSVFGTIMILQNTHIGGRQVFNIVRASSQTIWPHLFRETAASDIIKQDSSIIAAFKVQRRLDLEDFRTGFNYLKRFAADIIKKEETANV